MAANRPPFSLFQVQTLGGVYSVASVMVSLAPPNLVVKARWALPPRPRKGRRNGNPDGAVQARFSPRDSPCAYCRGNHAAWAAPQRLLERLSNEASDSHHRRRGHGRRPDRVRRDRSRRSGPRPLRRSPRPPGRASRRPLRASGRSPRRPPLEPAYPLGTRQPQRLLLQQPLVLRPAAAVLLRP